MGFIFILALTALIATARVCPDTPLGRLILDTFIDGPAKWLTRPNWRQALPYLAVIIGVALFMLAAPELAPLAAGFDVSLMADLLLATSAVLVQLGRRRIVQATQRIARRVMTIARPRTPRQPRTPRRQAPPTDDDPAPSPDAIFA